MQSCAGRGAQSFRRERVRGAADAGSGGSRAGRTESGSGAQDGADVARVLDAGEDDEEGSASRLGGADEIVEGGFAWMNQRGDALRMLGVGKAFEEAVRGAKDRKSHFGPVDEGGETFVMAFAGFAEEYGLNAAARAQRFFDEAHAFDADEAAFRGQAAAEGYAELLEPAIVAAGEEPRAIRRRTVTARSFAGCSHHRGG